MKKGIHPNNYRLVVFKDSSSDYAFLTRSTVNTKETITWDDGNEYPLCKIEISNKSHPFFTGKQTWWIQQDVSRNSTVNTAVNNCISNQWLCEQFLILG